MLSNEPNMNSVRCPSAP